MSLISKLQLATTFNLNDQVPIDQGVPPVTKRLPLGLILPVGFTFNVQAGLNYNALVTDVVNVVIEMTNGASNTITVAKRDTANFIWPIGSCLIAYQFGGGATSWVGAAGVTIRNSSSQRTRTQYSWMALICSAPDDWVCVGDFL